MISFDPVTHTYTRNNVQYISVTTLLKNYGLSADYTGIPQDVLLKASQRGNATHKAIEDYINTNTVTPNNIDLDNFIKYVTARGIDTSKSISEEVIYDDTYQIAGTIDWQYEDNGDEIIADHKTTATIHWNSVAWQLSIYNFIKCKGDVIQYYIKKLKVLHYYQGKLTVRDIPPIEYEEVLKLLNANLMGAPYTYTPDLSKIMSTSEATMLRVIMDDIDQCETLLNDLVKKKEAIQQKLAERMVQNNKRECDVENFHLVYTGETSRKTLDLDKIKQLCGVLNVDINTMYKTSTTKAKLKVTRRS